jgi:hypothetical protein
MAYLLAARGRRIVRLNVSRQDHVYGTGQVFDKRQCPIPGLMRHLRGVALVEVALLGSGMVHAARLGPLVPTPCVSQRIPSCSVGAVVITVAVAVVAARAQEEHLAASPAGHKP